MDKNIPYAVAPAEAGEVSLSLRNEEWAFNVTRWRSVETLTDGPSDIHISHYICVIVNLSRPRKLNPHQ